MKNEKVKELMIEKIEELKINNDHSPVKPMTFANCPLTINPKVSGRISH